MSFVNFDKQYVYVLCMFNSTICMWFIKIGSIESQAKRFKSCHLILHSLYCLFYLRLIQLYRKQTWTYTGAVSYLFLSYFVHPIECTSQINSSIHPSSPAGHTRLASRILLTLVIGQLDQQMSKHVLILSGRVISSVRCHVVRCLQALFLLIPACVSLSKLIMP